MKVSRWVSSNGELTPDGKTLTAWIESHFVEADKMNDVAHINGLPGVIKDYYVRVTKSGYFTPQDYLTEFPNAANALWRNREQLREAAEQAAQVEETATQADTLAAELEKFQASVKRELAKLRKENKTLREQVEALVETEEAETEPEVEPEADEADEVPEADADEAEEEADETDDTEPEAESEEA
jgi:hypothetical protein